MIFQVRFIQIRAITHVTLLTTGVQICNSLARASKCDIDSGMQFEGLLVQFMVGFHGGAGDPDCCLPFLTLKAVGSSLSPVC